MQWSSEQAQPQERFHSGTLSFFIFSLSVSPCMIIVFSLPAVAFLGFASTEYKTLCVAHKYAGVHVLTQTNKHKEALGLRFSLGTGLIIFNLMCAFSPLYTGCMASLILLFWCFCLSLTGTSTYDYMVSENAEKLLEVWITEIKMRTNN